MNDRDDKKRDGFKGERMIVIPTEAFQDYMEHPQIKRLYLTEVGFFPQAKNHYRERMEGIEEYIFLYCLEGCGVIEVLGERYRLRENEAFCIPRNKGHRYYASGQEPWSILWAHFNGEDTSLFPLEGCQVVSITSQNSNSQMLNFFEQLFRTLDGNYTLGNFIYITQILSLILAETYCHEREDSSQEQNKHVTGVIRYMYRHLTESMTLEQLADKFDLSKSYLNIIFKKCTGHAPIDFYLNLKMKEACKLLRSTNLYIYEVGERLGYRDQYYFSRIFKKTIGVSPREYQEGVY